MLLHEDGQITWIRVTADEVTFAESLLWRRVEEIIPFCGPGFLEE
ncbi:MULTISPECIES: hypothetical protein [unclassified Gordonia (in: high G+C Gram-positive bacteria)]